MGKKIAENKKSNKKTNKPVSKKTIRSKRKTRKTNNKKINLKKKNSGIKKNNKVFIPGTIFIFSLLIVLFIVIVYTLFIFPGQLKNKIKKDLISLYEPEIIDDSDNLIILKLKQKPDLKTQQKVFNSFKNKYKLSLKFEKIKSADKTGINKLTFYKNTKLQNDIPPVYIFWQNIIIIEEKKIYAYENIKIKQKNWHKTSSYEKIEEKRKNEKQETIIKAEDKEFKYCNKTITNKNYPRIAIVLDDAGYSYSSTYEFLKLGFPVTLSLIPDSPKSKEFYNLCNKYGYDIMLHIPMEPLKGKKYVEKNALFVDMNDNDIKNRIIYFLNKYPAIKGANNHMGSKAVTDARLMNIVLEELHIRNKFWLDSMTNYNTVSKEVSMIYNIPYYERDVFLDNNKDISSIKNAMNELISNAKQKGYAIGIGHVQTGSLAKVLKEYYDKKNSIEIEFVTISDLKK